MYWKEKNPNLECGMRETSQWIKYLVFNMRVRAWIPSSEWPVAPEGRATPWAKLAGETSSIGNTGLHWESLSSCIPRRVIEEDFLMHLRVHTCHVCENMQTHRQAHHTHIQNTMTTGMWNLLIAFNWFYFYLHVPVCVHVSMCTHVCACVCDHMNAGAHRGQRTTSGLLKLEL